MNEQQTHNSGFEHKYVFLYMDVNVKQQVLRGFIIGGLINSCTAIFYESKHPSGREHREHHLNRTVRRSFSQEHQRLYKASEIITHRLSSCNRENIIQNNLIQRDSVRWAPETRTEKPNIFSNPPGNTVKGKGWHFSPFFTRVQYMTSVSNGALGVKCVSVEILLMDAAQFVSWYGFIYVKAQWRTQTVRYRRHGLLCHRFYTAFGFLLVYQHYAKTTRERIKSYLFHNFCLKTKNY